MNAVAGIPWSDIEFTDFGDQEIRAMLGSSISIRIAIKKSDKNKAYIYTSDDKDSSWHDIKKYLFKTKGISAERVVLEEHEFQQIMIGKDDELSAAADRTNHANEKILFAALDRVVKDSASDVHIHIEVDKTRFYHRINNILVEQTQFNSSAALGRAIGKAIFSSLPRNKENVTDGDFVGSQKPCNATFSDYAGRRWRAGLYPSDSGPRIVIRELGRVVEKMSTLTELGFSELAKTVIYSKVNSEKGMVIVTGPTSSGKSTTLSSIIDYLNDGTRAIYSIEDPVERILLGTAQASADDKEREPAVLAKQLLRQDPDVIVYGEIRDAEITASAVRMATTGHLALATFHTNGALECVLSLEGELGVPLWRLASPGFLKAVIYQELVGAPCNHCALSYEDALSQMSKYDAVRIKDAFKDKISGMRFKRNGGCKECGNTGFSGKVLIFEVVPVDQVARKYISNRDIVGWEEHIKVSGWPMIADSAIEKIIEGKADLFSCENAIGSLTIEKSKSELTEYLGMVKYGV